MKIIVKIILIILPIFWAIWFIEPDVNENILSVSDSLELTPNYKLIRSFSFDVRMIGKQSITYFIDSVGIDEKYIVVLHYDYERGDEHPDWNTAKYYVISLEDDTMIGPMTPGEYEKSEYAYIKLKKINR